MSTPTPKCPRPSCYGATLYPYFGKMRCSQCFTEYAKTSAAPVYGASRTEEDNSAVTRMVTDTFNLLSSLSDTPSPPAPDLTPSDFNFGGGGGFSGGGSDGSW